MEALEKNISALKKLRWFFIIAGCIESWVFIVIANSFWGIIPGLITIILAHFINTNKKFGYYLSGWTFLKYNPMYIFTCIKIFGDFAKMPDSKFHFAAFAFELEILSFIVTILSIIFGIITLIKTIRYFRYKKINEIIEETKEIQDSVDI